jgi:predicted transporter
MADIVYLLCAATILACAVLLLRGYRRSGVRLLLWSGLCFVGMALNNALLWVDIKVFPETNLFLLRSLPTLVGLLLLIGGLIWDSQEA